jgi:Mesyanzhinovviridae DNA helicase
MTEAFQRAVLPTKRPSPPYQPRLPARQAQAEALVASHGKPAFALHMAMRVGKTKVVIDDFGMLEADHRIDDLLVIATGGSYETWETEIKKQAAENLLQRLEIFVWRSRKMKGQNKLRELKGFEIAQPDRPRCLLINIEALSTVKLAKAVCERFVKARRCMVAVDESTSIRHVKSKRTRFVVDKLAPYAKIRRTLTGLPNPKSPLDLYSQFEFLDKNILGFQTYAAFQERYADIERICFVPKTILRAKLRSRIGDTFIKPGFGRFTVNDLSQQELLRELSERNIYVQMIPRIKGFKNEIELRDKIKPYVYRKTLEDCYDLPPKTYVRRNVEMTEEQEKAYAEMQDFFTTQLENQEHVTAANVITCMLKLHQILCGHVKNERGVEQEIRTHRLTNLSDLLAEYDEKAIIWCSYDYDITAISRHLTNIYGAETIARFWGGNRNSREAEERRWFNDPQCRFMLATPAAGGKGRTWTTANLVVYYSNTHDLEHRLQSEERAQGVGKQSSVAYVDLVVPDTVDEKILLALRNKLTLATVINGDNFREWLI